MIAAQRSLRPQCAKCPWHDPAVAESVVPGIIAHARLHLDSFVCHTRCGQCDGPRHALAAGSLTP